MDDARQSVNCGVHVDEFNIEIDDVALNHLIDGVTIEFLEPVNTSTSQRTLVLMPLLSFEPDTTTNGYIRDLGFLAIPTHGWICTFMSIKW
jgi:hypothetical protein